MSKPIQKPMVQGVVSEPVVGNMRDMNSSRNDNDDNDNDRDSGSQDDNGGQDEDVFGQKFEIPAFLRKIH